MRAPSWRFELLDNSDQTLRALEGVSGGSTEIVAQSTLGGSGSLTLEAPQRDSGLHLDWMRHRVRPWFSDGDSEWPVGVFLFSSPTEHHDATTLRYEVGLLTKLNVLHEDTAEDRFTLLEGTNIVQAVVHLIQSAGEERMAVTESPLTLRSPLTWDAGTPKLRIINDLLGAAGYWGLWVDGLGLFRVEPYVNPARRPVSYTFEHGESSVHFPGWSREQDMVAVPNRFVAVGNGIADAPPLVGVAVNTDPQSPFSFQARGRWITRTEEGVEGETQQIMDANAERRLRDLMNPVSRISVTHKMLPLSPNDLVSFTPEDGVRRFATVQRMSISFSWDTDIDAEWREV